MFLDASVLVAVMIGESEREQILEELDLHPRLVTSALAIFETVARVKSFYRISFEEAQSYTEELLQQIDVETVPLGEETRRLAIACADRFHALSRHPARLNMGDCFAYAAARESGLPLAYKGDDFSHTDIDGRKFG